ncbi:SusC/RagA family TonB-linked outer membrane protein [Niabella beijingensis]|uniref:SusC/RagA family TonB-linked outer membrane protein n=1 Tax=Niabella beijingensis TaxID=2872700 RepID=UPI001CC18FA8|nr:TonB-dependent receptor [Niabella beijingensis]MBZ4187340.1 TonB-dependent receptor [Niabella beijingensis]
MKSDFFGCLSRRPGIFVRYLLLWGLFQLMAAALYAAGERKTAVTAGIPLWQDTVPPESWVLRGTVVNEKDNPLPGASVSVPHTSRGTITDVAGAFMLEVRPGDSLVITYQGYVTQELLPGIQRSIAIKMQPDLEEQKMNEVVVVGYGTQKKVTVTGAVSSVSVSNVQRIATPSLSNALAGSMPGIITRQSSGEPGYDGAQIFIRGFGTWNNRNPLILVDGVERDINLVNVQEVESITMLKDASATAVYGVQGANGVILITTKRGVQGKPKVVFRTENAVLTALRLPDYINGWEYASLINEASVRSGRAPAYTEDQLQKFKDGSDPYLYPDVNWTDVALKKKTTQTINNLGITGGGDVAKYYVNLGYSILNGIYKEDPSNPYPTNAQMKRYDFKSNVDINVSKSINIQMGIGGIFQKGNYPGTGAPDIFSAIKITSPINYPVTNPDGSVAGRSTSYLQNNPWALLTRSGYSTQERNTVQGTVVAKWDLSSLVTKGLNLRALFSYDHLYHNFVDRRKTFGIKELTGYDADGAGIYKTIREEQPMGFGTNNAANRNFYQELSLNYNRSFGAHTVTGLLLGNRREEVWLVANSSVNNLPRRRQGLATRLTYAYDTRYLLEFNAGYNGSEQFPPGKRFGFFPSVSAGWVVSNEKFWNSGFISSLKLRGSYGKVGNDKVRDDVRRFLYITRINTTTAQSTWFGENQAWLPGIEESDIGLADVTWEVATKSNLGIDLELLNGQLTLQLDGFREYRKGILIQRNVIPRVTGFFPWTIPYGNLGEAKNYGIDGVVEWKKNYQSSFFYNLRGTITYARSFVEKNDDPPARYSYQSYVGLPIDQPMGLVAIGFFKDQADIDNSPLQKYMEQVRPGDIKYQDTNGDGVIDDFDRVPIGYPRTPQLVYGVGGTVGYKGFELSLFFQGVAMASTFLDEASMYPFHFGVGTYNLMREYYDNRWIPGADNSNARYPAASWENNINNNRTNTLYLKNAAYVRLKSAEVAYSFKIRAIERYGLSGIRAFVNGMNLFTWDHIKVADPEANYGTPTYPLQRSVNLGLQLTF